MVRNTLLVGFALSAILIASALLRLYGVGDQSMTGDECFSWRLTEYNQSELVARTAADVHPPLYYLLLKLWVGMFGESQVALRSLSVLFGVISTGVAFLLGRDIHKSFPSHTRLCQRDAVLVGLLSATLVAVHAGQIDPARTARMYSLGALLSGLSSWLLILTMTRRNLWYGIGYVISGTAYAYTHNYALFSLFAFGLVSVTWVFVCRPHDWRPTLQKLLFAHLVIVLAYLPWLPILRSQTRSVQVDYWINPLEPSEIAAMACTWITGLAQPQQFEICLVSIFTCIATILAMRAYRVAASTLFALAVLPWLLAVTVGLISGQPILVERYLVFAQFPALVLLATACVAVTGRWERSVVFAVTVIGIGSIGLQDVVLKSTDHQWVLAESANEMNRDYRSGDLIILDRPATLNRVRYYLRQCGLADPNTCCPVSAGVPEGHVTHVSSIRTDEMIRAGNGLPERAPKRIWLTYDFYYSGEKLPPDFVVTRTRTIRGVNGTQSLLELAERK